MSETVSGIRVRDALLLCGALLLVVVTIAARKSGAGAAASTSVPGLQVAGLQQHLGEVAAGTVLRTRLAITNSGGRRLVINEVACGFCDTDVLPTTIVAPGETSRVELTWETAGSRGPLKLTRRFTTNDPLQPTFEVDVSADAVE
jgi:hypothetical protein